MDKIVKNLPPDKYVTLNSLKNLPSILFIGMEHRYKKGYKFFLTYLNSENLGAIGDAMTVCEKFKGISLQEYLHKCWLKYDYDVFVFKTQKDLFRWYIDEECFKQVSNMKKVFEYTENIISLQEINSNAFVGVKIFNNRYLIQKDFVNDKNIYYTINIHFEKSNEHATDSINTYIDEYWVNYKEVVFYLFESDAELKRWVFNL